jgi:hypothetical protein
LREKKQYKTPEVRSERVAIGVFGCYGDEGNGGGHGGGNNNGPLNFFNPFFRFCCN